jgi:predicted RNase H-like nuclease
VAVFVKTPNTILITNPKRRNVQIVLRVYPTLEAILQELDVDACSCAYNGTSVFVMERARTSLNTRVNIIDVSKRSWALENRLIKYAKC